MSKILYSKFSNDRAPEFAITTDIVLEDSGKRYVRKYGDTVESQKHIERILKWHDMLAKQFNRSKIGVCDCHMEDGILWFDFLNGQTLDDIADQYLLAGDMEQTKALLEEYIGLIQSCMSGNEYQQTEEFKKVFGDIEFGQPMKSASISDIDMILSNVIVIDNQWKLIDYEWSFDFPVPVDFIVYRVLKYYVYGNPGRCVLEDYFEEKFSDELVQKFEAMEENFQKYVRGQEVPLRELYEIIGKPCVNIGTMLDSQRRMMCIYFDRGEGYKQEHSRYIYAVNDRLNNYEIAVDIEDGVTSYRLDPAEDKCFIKIYSLSSDEDETVQYTVNGIRLQQNIYLCNKDPWIEFNTKPSMKGKVYIRFKMLNQFGEFSPFIIDPRAGRISAYTSQKEILKENRSLREDLQKAKNDTTLLGQGIESLRRENHMLMTSTSWKISKPVRMLGKVSREILKANRGIYGLAKRVRVRLNPDVKIEGQTEYTLPQIIDIMCPKSVREKQHSEKFAKNVKFSILVPLYNTPVRYLKEMITSVRCQTYTNWELCLADGSDSQHNKVEKICKRYMKQDSRIKYKKLDKNLGISGNTNACIEMSTGDYIALFDHDDFLHPSVLFENMKAICDYDADYIYTDEATFRGDNIMDIITKHCKPDFAIDNLRANNYICHFSVFSKALLDKAGTFRSEYDGSQDHDLILRLTGCAKHVYHIPKILYFWRSHPNSVAADINAKTYAIDAAKNAVRSHLASCGLEAEVESSIAFPTIFRLKYTLNETPKVSILIPNKDHMTDLQRCIQSIQIKSTYWDYEIIVIENNSTEPETFGYYETLKDVENIRVVTFNGEFNYSKINNYGASFATGEYLILLNNDTEIITYEWIEELLMYAQRPDVGAVGAKLHFEDGSIQHAGIVIGFGTDRVAGHIHYALPGNAAGYMGKLFYAQNVSAVTGACMMIRKSVYDEVGGLDEDFAVAYNDVDFCLRVREKGYLNVFTPYCELYHYESKSRGAEDTPEKRKRFEREVKRFKDRWQAFIDKGDPYFNPNISLDDPTCVIEDGIHIYS